MSFTEDENRHERESGHNEGECSCCSCSANENIFCKCEEDENEERAAFSRELNFLSAAGIIFFLLLITEEFYLDSVNKVLLSSAFIALYMVCGLPVLRSALRAISKLDIFNEFTLMGAATLSAVAIGEMSEAVGVMLFYRLGEAFQERASSGSRRSIKALLASKPLSARVLKDGEAIEVDPKEIVRGDIIQVMPGEMIPIDGIIRSGASDIDSSSMTGESVPVHAVQGDPVHGGTLALDGLLTIEAAGPFEDSTIARMLEMVQNAAARKSPTERFITRFAKWYTPAVFAIASMVAFIPPLTGHGELREWFYRGLVLLVISCPCALVISIPLGYFGGIGSASKRGILVKGANVFDALAKVTTAIFDKTGTLTYGRFKVTKVVPSEGTAREELLKAAASAESGSTHPLAAAVREAAGESEIAPEAVLTQASGKGMILTLGGSVTAAGNAALMEDFGIKAEEVSTPGTVIHVMKDGSYMGYIVLQDSLRKESGRAVRELREQGIREVYMLTGDRDSVAGLISDELGLNGYRSELMPDEKVEALKEICKGETEKTLYVGDGINDGPVLVTSETGIAMGGFGSQVAVEVADAVILDDSPLKVVELLRIARKTRAIVWQNVFMALGVKGIFLIGGAAGIAGLWEAVFADVGVALLAILNATRASRA